MDKQVEREITKIFNSVYKKIFSNENVKALKEGDKSKVLNTFATFTTSEKYNKFAEEFSKKLAQMGLSKQRGVWKKYYKVARETHNVALPYSYSEYERKILEDTIKHNFTMITSIPQRVMEVLEYKAVDTLIDEVANGKLPRGSFKRELDKHGVKKSQLIARTETAKLQSAITQNRATNIGSVAYEWVASMDRRTRPSHKEMDGVIVFWRPDAQKPLRDGMRGQAGSFPNCRCYPAPILDISDLSKTNYKVYNYHNDKIESWTRRDLIKAIERGYI